MKKNLAVRIGAIVMVLMVAFFSILPDLVSAEGDDLEPQAEIVAQEELAEGAEELPDAAEAPEENGAEEGVLDVPESGSSEVMPPEAETPDTEIQGTETQDTEIQGTEDVEGEDPDGQAPEEQAPEEDASEPSVEEPEGGSAIGGTPEGQEPTDEVDSTEPTVEAPVTETPETETSGEMDTVEDYLEILAKIRSERGEKGLEFERREAKASEWEALVDTPEDDFIWDDSNTVILGYQGRGGYITIPGHCVAIADGVFAGNTTITGVALPGQLSSIGASAFSGCVNLESVVIPDSVTSVGASAFANCTGLAALTIGAGTGTVTQNEFYGCVSLQGVSVPEGISSIASGAFAGCVNLSSISLPSTLNSLEVGAFAGDVNLASVSVSSASYSSYDGCIYTADGRQLLFCPQGKTGISFAPGMQSVGSGAFSGCRYLLSAVIPDVTDSIEADAFSGSAIKAVTIPVGVTAIGTQSGWTPSVVYGYTGSTAEMWANANHYIFESIDGSSTQDPGNTEDDQHIEDPEPGTETETETETEKPGGGKKPGSTGGGVNPVNGASPGSTGGATAVISGSRGRLVGATPKTGVEDYGIFFLSGAIFLIGAAAFAYSRKLRIDGK